MSGVSVMYWNARGLSGKFNELAELVRVENIDIACVSETHLTDNIQLRDIPNYNMIRHDRLTHLGGLVMLIRKGIKFDEVDLGTTDLLEYVGIIIEPVGKAKNSTIILNTYLPGGARNSDVQTYLKSDLTRLLQTNTKNRAIFLMGDLNAKHKSWNNVNNNKAGNILYEFLQNSKFTVAYPPDPTYVPLTDKKSTSTIDLLITNGLIRCSRPFVRNIFTSDHVPVFVTIHSGAQQSDETIRPNYFRTNWKKYRDIFDNHLYQLAINFRSVVSSTDDIDNAIRQMTDATATALKDSVPLERPSRNGTFLTDEIRRDIQRRNYFKRRWLRTHRIEDKAQYNALNRDIRTQIAILNKNRMSKELLDCKPGDNRLYKIIKNRKRKKIPPLVDNSKPRLHNDCDKAMALASHFRQMHDNPLARCDLVFTLGVNEYVRKFLEQNHSIDESLYISSKEVHGTVKSLKNGKSPGPDNLPTVAIKNYSQQGYYILTEIFNACVRTGYYPNCWKISCTVPVHKPGKDPTDRTSYRPIALISVLSKVFEKIICSKLNEFMSANKILHDLQFGFRKEHSTSHALTYLYNSIQDGFILKETSGVLSFDIEKAFDRVWHNGLLYKLIKLNFPRPLIYVLKSFLGDRSFYVRVGDEVSGRMDVPWGVPQGSALSPTLYNLYIHDIPLELPGENCKLMLYADDTIIFTRDRLINKVNNSLTSSADIIFNYYSKWKIGINKTKTTLTCFTFRKTKQLPGVSLTVHNEDIPWNSSLKYLGITLDSHLTLKTQALLYCDKMDNAIRVLYPYINRQSSLSKPLKIHIYRTYLLPILTYAAPVTSQMCKTNFKILEIKQNKCLRMLLDISWDSYTSNKIINATSGVESLEKITRRLRDSFMYSCSMSKNAIIRNF